MYEGNMTANKDNCLIEHISLEANRSQTESSMIAEIFREKNFEFKLTNKLD